MAQILLVVAVALAAGMQVLVAPSVGIADNGDFARLTGWFGMEHSASVHERYWKYADLHYDFHPGQAHDTHFYSSALPVAASAVALSRLARQPRFDLRWLGVLYGILLAVAAWLAAPALCALSSPGQIVACGFAVLAFADTAYVAYFNSFYTEPAAIVFFLLAVAFAVRLASETARDRRGVMAGFAVSAGLFILARPAGAAATPVAIAATFLLARNPRERRRLAVPAAVLVLLAGCLDLALTPRTVRDGISYFSVFWELLPSSPDPAQDLRELGLDPALVAYSGTHPWSSNSLAQRPEALRSFNSRVSLASVGRLYVRHPRRLWQALERISKDLWRDRVLHGNFDRSAGLPMAARSHRFSAWSSLKERVLPRRPISWCLLFAAAGGAIAVMGSGPGTARRAGLCALLLAAAAIDVLIVAVIGWFSDSPRLLVPFHLSIDTLVLLFLTAPFTRERSAPSASPAAEGASMETSDNTR